MNKETDSIVQLTILGVVTVIMVLVFIIFVRIDNYTKPPIIIGEKLPNIVKDI